MRGEQARQIGYWCPLADSSKSVVKEGTFVFGGEGYLSTVIDIQLHWTASGCTHPSGANHCVLPEKFTLPPALESVCCNSPVHTGDFIPIQWRYIFHLQTYNVLAYIFRHTTFPFKSTGKQSQTFWPQCKFAVYCGILNNIFAICCANSKQQLIIVNCTTKR